MDPEGGTFVWVPFHFPGQAMALVKEVNGRFVVAELHLVSFSADGLRPSDLRTVSLPAARADAKWQKETKLTGLDLLRETVRRMSTSAEERRKGKPKDSNLLALVSHLYLEALEISRHPHRFVVEDLEKRYGIKLSEPTSELVRAARRAGYLEKSGKPGAAGGRATPKLEEWRRKNLRRKRGKR